MNDTTNTNNDLSTVVATTSRLEIRHPSTGELTGLVLHLRPMSHPDVKAVSRKFTNQNLRMQRVKITSEKLDIHRLDLLVTAIERWEWTGTASWAGEKLELTPENVRKVLKTDWIRSQADEALGDEAAFFQN